MVMRNKDYELYKLLDIYLFIKRGYVDIFDLYGKVKRYGIEKTVYEVLSDISEIFGEPQLAEYAEIFKSEESVLRKVIEPPSGKTYIFNNRLGERLGIFNKSIFLKEVKDNE